jgi:hypothetical protein
VGRGIGAGIRDFTSPHTVQPSFGAYQVISDGYRGLFTQGYSGRGPKLNTHFYPVLRSGMVELYTSSPLCVFREWCLIS